MTIYILLGYLIYYILKKIYNLIKSCQLHPFTKKWDTINL